MGYYRHDCSRADRTPGQGAEEEFRVRGSCGLARLDGAFTTGGTCDGGQRRTDRGLSGEVEALLSPSCTRRPQNLTDALQDGGKDMGRIGGKRLPSL